MDKKAIKAKVEQAAEGHLSKAIKEEGEYRARDTVRKAMYEEDEKSNPGVGGEGGKDDDKAEVLESHVTTLQHTDPRIHKR